MAKSNKHNNEMVFCVPANEVEFVDKEFWSYDKGKVPKNIWSLFDNKGRYILRDSVEGVNGLYQIVPYIIIINSEGKILSHISKSTGKISLGYSSHINPEVAGHMEVVYKACRHTVITEVGPFSFGSRLEFLGYIKTFTEVTKGHLGMCFTILADKLEIKDTEHFKYEFKTIKELSDSYGNLEKWGKLVLNNFVERE